MPGDLILLVEDDENLGFVIKDNLQLHGYDVHWCKDGVSGMNNYRSGGTRDRR